MEKIKCNVSVEEPTNNSRRLSKSSAALLPLQTGSMSSRQSDNGGLLIKQWQHFKKTSML
jgi:hypothetical protein